MYVTYTRIYGWSDYGGESSYQPGYRLENMMWMTLLVYDYIIPGRDIMANPNKETLLAFQEVEKMRQHPERVKSYQSFGELLQEVQKQNERKKHL